MVNDIRNQSRSIAERGARGKTAGGISYLHVSAGRALNAWRDRLLDLILRVVIDLARVLMILARRPVSLHGGPSAPVVRPR